MDTERVLLVEAEPRNRREYGEWLEEAGFEVIMCPGPSAPDYTCVGGREGRCPLVEPADVVVLDLDLDSEIEGEGTSALELLALYRASEKPVVAVGSDPRIGGMLPDEQATALLGPPTRGQLIKAVHESIARAVDDDPTAPRASHPHLMENVSAWEQPPPMAGVFFGPQPGPGDSEGGDAVGP